MKLSKTRTVLLFGALAASLLAGQVAKEANKRYKTKETRAEAAKGLEAPDRDATQKPKELVAALALPPGITVADIGTGTGYMLPWLSRAVGPAGKVLAEDIFPDYLEKAQAAARKAKLSNITFVLGTETDPKLPDNAVDVALALDSYHHWDYPEKMLASLHRYFKPGGRLVIVDYYKNKDAMPEGGALQHIRVDKAEVIREVEANGFRLVSQRDHNPGKQYILVLEKK